ncbi:hypothetical protein [Enterobacter hormaechei]|nr:hypothetical protein [Enterobacter hormaechei]
MSTEHRIEQSEREAQQQAATDKRAEQVSASRRKHCTVERCGDGGTSPR